MPEATARLVETNSHQASLDQASQPEEPPAVSASVTTLRSDESKAAELVVTQRSADDSSGTETSVAETTPEPAAEQLVASPTEEDPTRTTPKVAGAIAETQPVIDSASAPYQKQPSLEALPSAPQPQGLPTLREPVVPIQCESIAPDVPEVTTATPEPDVTPLVAPTPIVSQAQAIDGEGLLLENGSIRTREAVPTVSRTEQSQPLQAAPADAITRRVTTLQAATSQDLSSNVPALASTPASLAPHPIDRRASERPANGQNGTEGQTDPPFGRPFRLSPTAAQSASAVAIPELKPQFGPAYGMAPTAEGLLPISVMPEVAALTPEPKPRSMFSTTVIAGVLGIAALAFYYGPFRPKGSTTPRTQSVQHEAGPLTIPSVADPARASTSASNPLPTSNPVPTTATVPTISPAASVPPTSNLTAPVAVKPEATAQTPVVPAPGVAAKPTPTPASTMAKVIPPVVSAQTVAPAQTATAKIPPPTDPVSSATATPVSPSAGTRRVNITAASLLWFSACSDGKPAFAKVMHTGDTMDIDFHQAIVFKLGNSAAAQLILDGKPLGTLGPPGSVKVVELGAAGLRELPPTSTAGTECQPASAAAKR